MLSVKCVVKIACIMLIFVNVSRNYSDGEEDAGMMSQSFLFYFFTNSMCICMSWNLSPKSSIVLLFSGKKGNVNKTLMKQDHANFIAFFLLLYF
jgi:hypothetical protein